MKRINIDKKIECAGCGACVSICPKDCFSLVNDELGFTYSSYTNIEDCIDCGLCAKVCPQKDVNSDTDIPQTAIYGQIKNIHELNESSSGGFFTQLAKFVLQNGGLVWGVEMTSEGHAHFTYIKKESELYKLRGSKYTEVVKPLDFVKIKQQIKENCLVLVSGTPCQIRALYKYLGSKRNPNLILVDLLCYGIQSPHMWNLYLREINPEGKGINRIQMRNKDWSWFDYSMKIEYTDGSIYRKSRYKDSWLRTYSTSLFNRESCSACQSKNSPHVSDFTIGDFWGYDYYKNSIKLDKRKGLSLAFLNTQKAQDIFEILSKDIVFDYLPQEYIIKTYPSFSVSAKINPNREAFITIAQKDGFSIATNKFTKSGITLWFVKNKMKIRYKAIDQPKRFVKTILKTIVCK